MSQNETTTGFFGKIKVGLSKTRDSFAKRFHEITQKRKLEHEDIDRLEDTMLLSDFGVQATTEIIDFIQSKRFDKDNSPEQIYQHLAQYLSEELAKNSGNLIMPTDYNTLHTILVAGVNGSGKTTSVAKIAYKYKKAGYKVLIVAADTFRAAATEQLSIWAKRIDIEIFKQNTGSDAATLIYKAYEYAHDNAFNIMIIDTAGRLQNQVNLMDELEKITRILKKFSYASTQDRYLVLDATTGQNALSQVDIFHKTLSLNGLIITKMDGTSKGGIIVAICKKYDILIRAICVGEKIDDMIPFNAHDYANALMDRPSTISKDISS